MSQPRVTLREGSRTLPRPVWLPCAGTFVNRFGSFVAVFLVLWLLCGLLGAARERCSSYRGRVHSEQPSDVRRPLIARRSTPAVA
jgi:hypothetical protein